MSGGDSPLLAALAVTKVYGPPGAIAPGLAINHDGRFVTALREVSLQVAAGEFVAIVGPSGCGKSTLLHLLAGLDHPTAGRVMFDGADLASLDRAARATLRRRRIGLVFQRIHLLANLTAIENVQLPLAADGAEQPRRA